jgi:uncharacterized phage protein (TIGR02218 family)
VKTISGALTTLFASQNQFAKADLFTWTFIDGTVLRTTSADVALKFGGFTFASCAPIIERTKVSVKLGVDVDSVNLTVKPIATDLVGGLPWGQATRQGYLDGAQVLIETAYIQTWPTVVGTMHVFQGAVSDTFPQRTSVMVTVKSALEVLARPFPRNLYQSVCLHALYDAGCTLAKTSFQQNLTVTAGSTTNLIACSTTPSPVDYFDRGTVTFTSGLNAGLKRTVKNYAGGGFNLALPLPFAPATGDTFSAYAGCDHKQETCSGKFGNLIHFRAFPFVPVPETVR